MKITLKDIEGAVCQKFRVTHEQIMGGDRHRRYARPRQIIMYLARQHTTLSYPQIGRLMGRHHTTILYGYRVIEDLLGKKPKLAAHVQEISAAMIPVAEARAQIEQQYIDRLSRGEIVLQEKAA